MNNNVEIEILKYTRIEAETSLAWLMRINKKNIWLPKKICVIYKISKEIHIPLWLAEKEDLVKYG